ncbi:alpha/beta hydrolase [Dehalococcoides mccartyi]|nr:alpha/beta hydrolase [Dehalococcoides mccartyi]
MPYIDNDGVKIWFEVEGEGAPLMLVHGTTGNLNIWRRLGVVDALKSDYKLILMDGRGHGQSDKPHEPVAYLPEPKSKDIEAILDSLGIDTTHYLGYSMGGRFGFDVVVHAPHRLRSLVAGGAGPSPKALLESTQFSRGKSIEELLQESESVSGRMPEEPRVDFLANDIDAISASQDNSILDQESVYRKALSEFRQPTLMFVGTEDPRHSDIEGTARGMTNAEFISVEGLDHGGVMQQISGILPQIKSFIDAV